MAVVVAGGMAAATVIESGHLLHGYWSRPDRAGAVFLVTVIGGARLASKDFGRMAAAK